MFPGGCRYLYNTYFFWSPTFISMLGLLSLSLCIYLKMYYIIYTHCICLWIYIYMYVWICVWVSCFHLLPQVTHWDEHAIYCSAQKCIWVKNQLPTVRGIQEEGRSFPPCCTHLAIFTGPGHGLCNKSVPQNVQVPNLTSIPLK